jgi:hypothetical protein
MAERAVSGSPEHVVIVCLNFQGDANNGFCKSSNISDYVDGIIAGVVVDVDLGDTAAGLHQYVIDHVPVT